MNYLDTSYLNYIISFLGILKGTRNQRDKRIAILGPRKMPHAINKYLKLKS